MTGLGLGHLGGGAGGGHLGSRLDAVVDGQLTHDERDRVLAHIARCPDCHEALREARAMKAALRRLAEADVPGDLTTRLLALGSSDSPLTPPVSDLDGLPGAAAHARGRRRGAGALSVVGLAVGAALLVSAPGAPGGAGGPRTTGADVPGGARVNGPGTGSGGAGTTLVSVPRTPPATATTRNGRGRARSTGAVPYVPVVAQDRLVSRFAPASVRVVRSTPSPFRARMLASEVPLHAR